MIHSLPGICLRPPVGLRRFAGAAALVLVLSFVNAVAQTGSSAQAHSYFVDCSIAVAGDGSRLAPWNSLAAAQAHDFAPGDRIALARGTVCHGSFAPQGSGAEGNNIRLTAYGQGQRPRIVATGKDRQALLLFNQEYWQIDSLDLTDKDLTRRSSLRRGLTMFVISRSLAAISWSIGVNRKKLSRLTRQISTSGRCASNFSRCRAA